MGIIFVALLLAGVYLVLRFADAERRTEMIVPCVMLLGAFAFAIETGIGRAELVNRGATFVRQGHYMQVVAFLAIPAVAMFFEEAVRQWRRIAPVLGALLLVALVANTRTLIHLEDNKRQQIAKFRSAVLAIPRLPLAKEVPRRMHPFEGVATPITVGWLLDSDRTGRIPRSHPTRASRTAATLRISLALSLSRKTPCQTIKETVIRQLNKGASIRFRGTGVFIAELEDGRPGTPVSFAPDSNLEWTLTNVGQPITVRVFSAPHQRAMLCQ